MMLIPRPQIAVLYLLAYLDRQVILNFHKESTR